MLLEGRIELSLINRNLLFSWQVFPILFRNMIWKYPEIQLSRINGLKQKLLRFFYCHPIRSIGMIVRFVRNICYLGVDVITCFVINKTLQLHVGSFTWEKRLPIDHPKLWKGWWSSRPCMNDEAKVVGKCF